MDAGEHYKNPALVVARLDAEKAVRALHRAGLLDPTRKIAGGGEHVLIPVRAAPELSDWALRLAARIVEAPPLAPREGRVTPYEQVLARLEGALPDERLAEVPAKWEQHGDVLVVRLPESLRPHAGVVARAYADALVLRAVIDDRAGVSGELREMQGALLLGEDPVATHVENGIRYRFDASRIMFSSGNVAERARAAGIPAACETVVDMFAGIGYFTLPLAMHARPARVHALEKNPVSFRYLVENVDLNGVKGVVEPWLGDNREYPHEGIADRVLMGYFPRTEAFLPKALALLKPRGGVIHFHNTAHAESWKDEMTRQVLDAARACGRVVRIEEARIVKTHSPGVVHAVVVARVAG